MGESSLGDVMVKGISVSVGYQHAFEKKCNEHNLFVYRSLCSIHRSKQNNYYFAHDIIITILLLLYYYYIPGAVLIFLHEMGRGKARPFGELELIILT